MDTYNTKQKTESYIKQLDEWVKKIKGYKYRGKEIIDEKGLHKLKTFPINKKGDILLILNSEYNFASHSFGRRLEIRGKELDGKICQVLGLFDNTTGSYHGGPDGDYDLEVKVDGRTWPLYVDEHFVAYATSSLPPYVFLPNNKLFEDFKRFLPFFAKKPDKLEKILERYYSQLEKQIIK